MMDDLNLFDYDPGDSEPDSIAAKFSAFHRDNPQVYRTLVRLARSAVARGKGTIGIGMLWEVMRWEVWLEVEGDDYKLNNNYRSRYARLIMDQEMDLAGIFETRKLRAA